MLALCPRAYLCTGLYRMNQQLKGYLGWAAKSEQLQSAADTNHKVFKKTGAQSDLYLPEMF